MADPQATRDERPPPALASEREDVTRRRTWRPRGGVAVRAMAPLTPELGTFLTRRAADARLADEPWPPALALDLLRHVAALLDEADAGGDAVAPFTPRCLALDGPTLVLLPADDVASADRAYVAPEQALRGAEPDGRASQYGLATLAMAILVPDERAAAARGGDVATPPGVPHPGLDPAVVRVLLAGRAPEPEWRFSTAGDFVVALDAACGAWAQPAYATGDTEPSWAPAYLETPPTSAAPAVLGAWRPSTIGWLVELTVVAAVAGGSAMWMIARRSADVPSPTAVAPVGVGQASGGEVEQPAAAAVAPRAPERPSLRTPSMAADALARPDDPEPSWAPAPLPREAGRRPAPAAEAPRAPAERAEAPARERTRSRAEPEARVPPLPSSAARNVQAAANALAAATLARPPATRPVVDPREFAAGGLRSPQSRPGDSAAPGRRASGMSPDVAATSAPGSVVPSYPLAMLSRRIPGQVVARFVVDSNGRPEAGTFELVSTTDVAFSAAVRAALGQMRYLPAESGGRRVRQTVEQTFRFDPPR